MRHSLRQTQEHLKKAKKKKKSKPLKSYRVLWTQQNKSVIADEETWQENTLPNDSLAKLSHETLC